MPGTMTEAEMRTVVERFTDESWNGGDLDALDEFFAPDYVGHDAPRPEPVRGPEGMRQFLTDYRTAFPDAVITLDDVLFSGDKVITRWHCNGTHEGVLMGVAPTGKAIAFTGIRIFRLSNGKIVEGWVVWDTFGLLKQLGAI